MLKLPVVLLAALLAGCGGGSADPPPDDDSPVLFHFKMRGMPGQDFRAILERREVKAQARAQLRLPAAQRNLHVVGVLARTNGGHNLNWSWHLRRVELAEVSVELCDASPRLIEQDLDFYLGLPSGVVCPWGSYVHAEVGPV